jgi:hypothetical protein
MKLPAIAGIIDRRILINYQVEEEVLRNFLPAPFTPLVINGKGMAGICLIRLKNIKPKWIPGNFGISSENAAHRIAVEWNDKGQIKQGVFIPRRDTSSRVNHWAGGRIFPGEHHLAKFSVDEKEGRYSLQFESGDKTFMTIKAEETQNWNRESVFDSLGSASDFFKKGATGYCPDKSCNGFDGLELRTYKWEVSPLKVQEVRSSFFEDEKKFPANSIKFDNALLMTEIKHDWISLGKLGEENKKSVSSLP